MHRNTDRLCGFDGHKAVISLFPADVAKGSVVCNVLGDVGDLMDCMVVLENLRRDIKHDEWSFILSGKEKLQHRPTVGDVFMKTD